MERTKARTQHLDNKILFKIQELHGPRLDKAMTFFTLMGNGALIWVFTGIFITLFTQYKYHGVLLIVTIIMTTFSNMFIKSRFNRLRPCDIYKDVPILIRRPMGSSLPSGHTASSFASATILLHMNYKIGLIALALAFIISFQTVFICTFSIGRIVWPPFRNCCGVNQYSNCITFDLKKNRRRFIVCVGSFFSSLYEKSLRTRTAAYYYEEKKVYRKMQYRG